MKTSNKLLLSFLVLTLLVLTGIHLALYAKLKNGDFTVEKGDNRSETINLQPVKFLRLQGLDDVSIVYSDTFSLEIEKEYPSYFKYSVSGDTLIVKGDTIVSRRGAKAERRNLRHRVVLHLPELEGIKVLYSGLTLRGGSDTAVIGDFNIDLHQSRLLLGKQIGGPEKKPVYFNRLKVVARDASNVVLGASNFNISDFDCTLLGSRLNDENANAGRLTLTTDEQSSVQLSGNNIRKLNAGLRP
jgi:hypothetical protein